MTLHHLEISETFSQKIFKKQKEKTCGYNSRLVWKVSAADVNIIIALTCIASKLVVLFHCWLMAFPTVVNVHIEKQLWVFFFLSLFFLCSHFLEALFFSNRNQKLLAVGNALGVWTLGESDRCNLLLVQHHHHHKTVVVIKCACRKDMTLWTVTNVCPS